MTARWWTVAKNKMSQTSLHDKGRSVINREDSIGKISTGILWLYSVNSCPAILSNKQAVGKHPSWNFYSVAAKLVGQLNPENKFSSFHFHTAVSSSILKIMMPFGIFINNLANGIQNGLIIFTNDIKLNEDTLGTGLEFKKAWTN